ncbi:HNH endonuclease signature motif containing protein, partial [Nocardioides bigeumensis]
STQGGEGLIREALVLRHRLPQVWARVQALEVPAWRARRIARAVYARPADVSDYLDEHVGPVAEKVGTTTIDRLIDEAMLRLHAEERELAQLEALDATGVTLHEESINHTGVADMTIRAPWADLHDFDTTVTEVAHCLEPAHAQEPFEARRARAVGVLADPAHAAALLAAGTQTPGTQTPAEETLGAETPGAGSGRAARRSRRGVHLFVHVTEQSLHGALGGEVARVETTTGGAGRPVLAQQVASWCGRAETEVRVTKVIDLNQPVSVDRYEVGARMALRVALREPTCVFPWCSRPARQCDKDHCTPYAEGGETCDHNLAPLCRRHHRLKTHTAWTYERLPLDIGWRWTDPHGMRYLRDHHGTRPLRRRRHLQTA